MTLSSFSQPHFVFPTLNLCIQRKILTLLNVIFARRGRCHGVALWMEYSLTDDITVSMGLTEPVTEEVFHAILHVCFCSPEDIEY